MMSSPDEACFFTMLMKLIGAKKTIEVGVFTGYSTLATALGLPEDGKVVALDVSEEFTNVGRPYWKGAGVEGRLVHFF
jgi:caffeoyl-CoA O-methyltransferase/tricin synthase